MRRVLVGLIGLVCAGPVLAHELWISPTAYQIASGDPVAADIRVGQDLDGPRYGFLPRDFKRFDVIQNANVQPVEGRAGDRPALNNAVAGDGLVTIVYVSRDLFLTYTDFAKFEKFAKHKDFEWAVAQHSERGMPTDRFREKYVRYAKSLVTVGTGEGADLEAGLETEIVALANPYTDDLSDGFAVKVLYQGAPRADAQVELFAKTAAGEVEITLHRTDDAGIAVLPVVAGVEYLADAVVLRANDPDADGGAVWESLWASLTFRVPDS